MPASAQCKSGCAQVVFEQRKMQEGFLQCYQSMDQDRKVRSHKEAKLEYLDRSRSPQSNHPSRVRVGGFQVQICYAIADWYNFVQDDNRVVLNSALVGSTWGARASGVKKEALNWCVAIGD